MIHTLKVLESNYSYIIEDKLEALVIDPGVATPILDLVTSLGLKITYILLTHNHSDHNAGVSDILNNYPNATLVDTKSNSFTFNTIPIEIIKTPGHTTDSCSFYLPTLSSVFTGDTLFTGICGRLLGGTFEQFHNSLMNLKMLPQETKIYPGHEYLDNSISFINLINGNTNFYTSLKKLPNPSLNSTIGDEIIHNPFFTSDFKTFKKLRKLKG